MNRTYIDGNASHSSTNRATLNASAMSFRLLFGRTRYRYVAFSGLRGTAFEGWISEIRLANRSMHGSEALRQINNNSVWQLSYSVNGCSGENHIATDIDRFKLQQAWLVCKEALPTCGAEGDFVVNELVGCLCEMDNGEQQCVGGSSTALSTNAATTTALSTNVSTAITMTTTTVANDTVRETVVATVSEPPPAWIFGVAGGGVVALLLLIGAISLACWCSKRAAVAQLPPSTQQTMMMMMSSNDTNMNSFRETSSSPSSMIYYGMFRDNNIYYL